MPRFTAPAPNEESRKALEQRARQAAMPLPVKEKKHWPFTVVKEDSGSVDHDETKKSERREEHKPD